MNKLLAVLIGCLLISILGISASAESMTDPSGDVFHWWQTGGTFTWEYDASKPDIDIVGYAYELSGNTLTVTMSVDGTINDGELYSYSVSFINDNDGSTYMVTYVGGEGFTYYLSASGGGTGEATVSGNTLSGTFDTTITDVAGFELMAIAHEYTIMDDVTAEYWVDSTITEDESDSGTDDTGGDDSGTDDSGTTDSGDSSGEDSTTNTPPPSGTPGFELLTLIASLGVTFILLRRKH